MEAAPSGAILLGRLGNGARLKLINNFLCGVQIAALAEALVWVEQSGLDPRQALAVFSNGAPGSTIVRGVGDRMISKNEEMNFMLALMAKDLRYALTDALSFGVTLDAARTAEASFHYGEQSGFGRRDVSALLEPLRRRVKP